MDIERLMAPAAWIWCDNSQEVNQYARFYQTFAAVPAETTLYICADSAYAVYINGQYVPGFACADYPECRSVDALSLAPYLHAGENRLCIVGYCPVSSSFCYRRGAPGLRFAVYGGESLLAASGTETLCSRPRDYIGGEMEWITSQLGYSFRYDAAAYDGWLEEDYRPDASWHTAVLSATQARVQPRPILPLTLGGPQTATVCGFGTFADDPARENAPVGERMQYAALRFADRVMRDGSHPFALPCAGGLTLERAGDDGIYAVLDLGAETAGLLTLDLELPQAATVLVGFGEHLQDLRVRTAVGGRQFAAVFRGRAGRTRFQYPFRRLGARYVQLHIYAPSVRLFYAGICPVEYPLPAAVPFSTGDFLLDAVDRTAVKTLRLCVHEHYEDCPWREQGLYAMDSRIQMLCGYYAFGETAMPRASLRLLARGERADHLLDLCAPCDFERTIPGFSLAFVSAVCEYTDFSGDCTLAAELHPLLCRILCFFLPLLNESGLLQNPTGGAYWNFFEWTEGMEGYDTVPAAFAALQAQFVMAAKQYRRLCARCGLPGQPELEAAVGRIRRGAQRFWSGERQAFACAVGAERRDNELTQALMVCAGFATPEQERIVLKKLAEPGKNGLIPVSLSHSIYKYDALMQAEEDYGDFVKRDIARIWGGMLFQGATSFWETQNGAWDFDNGGSLCHGWSAVPAYVLRRYADRLFGQRRKEHEVHT